MAICFLCNENFELFETLLAHFKYIHKVHQNNTYRCREQNCYRDFVNLKTFKQHFWREHDKKIDFNIKNKSNENESNKLFIDNTYQNINFNSSTDEGCSYPAEINLNIDKFTISLKLETLKFLASLYDSPLIPRNVVQVIVSYFQKFFNGEFVSVFKNYILENLKKLSATDSILNNFETMFNNLINPFENFNTEYKIFKEFQNCESLIKPIEYTIGHRSAASKSNNAMSYSLSNVTGQFIPLRQIFTKLFQIDSIRNGVVDYLKTLKDDENKEVCNQSKLFKNIKYQKNTSEIVLPLFLYYDDYEAGNPLGSHSGVHKLGGVYVSIACFPPKYRSLLDNIFLALLFNTNDKREYGNRAVFKILVDELKYLENEGISIQTEKTQIKIYFVLTLILGDNLGLHSILGFYESFSATFNCRFCKATKLQSQSLCHVDNLLIRTVDTYNNDTNNVDSLSGGLKEICIFNELKFFHVTSNYSVDIMHDLLEGVCHYDMLHILKYLIFQANFFTLDVLNFRIQLFNYGFEENNKPPNLKSSFHSKNKLSMSASEMNCFVRYFGLLIGDLVPCDNEVWSFYLILRQIVSLVFCTTVNDSLINNLQSLISDHNSLYIKLFNDSLKPKHHHLIHYPAIIKQIGPIANISSMRYESKHRLSKMTANVTCSRRNLPYSLALKHQLKICFRLLNSNGFEDMLVVGPCKLSSLVYFKENYPDFMLPQTFLESDVVKWVKMCNIIYKKHLPIIVGIENMLPSFGIIEEVLVNNNNLVGFLYQKLDVISFDEHVYAFKVSKTSELQILNLENVFIPCTPVTLNLMPNGHWYISTRVDFFDQCIYGLVLSFL